MWKCIYVSTYTDKQEYGQFVTDSLTLLYLCTFHFLTWRRNHIQIELSCLFSAKFWGEHVQQREMFSHPSTFSVPSTSLSCWTSYLMVQLFVFYPYFNLSFPSLLGFPSGSDGKESACSVGDLGSVSEFGRSLREGNGFLLQYSCLENSMDRGAWQLQSMVWQRVGHNWVTNTFTFLPSYCPYQRRSCQFHHWFKGEAWKGSI